MFQNFDDIGGPQHSASRLHGLRDELQKAGLTGFLLPRSDKFQNEFVAPEAEQLLWLTGFSGSWGVAVILMDKAALIVDGRYTLQASRQVDCSAYEIVHTADYSFSTWLEANLKPQDRLGYDPHLHTMAQVKSLAKSVQKAEAKLVPVDRNPLAALWTDRQISEPKPVELHPLDFAGVKAQEKISRIQKQLLRDHCDAVIVTSLDSIAWLFNIRGQDLPHTPFVESHAIVPAKGKAQLFINGRKLSSDVRQALSEFAEIAEPDALAENLHALGEQKARVLLDPVSTPQWYANQLTQSGATIEEGRDPCTLPKARKNSAEIAGSRAAHLRDGAAVCRFLCWFDEVAPAGELDEITAAQKLEEFRRATNKLRDISFDTIAGFGPNGAIVHYRPSCSTNRKIEPGSLFLIDSGAQYQDGTTDITRTLAIGEPSAEMRRHYTLVLKGHIAIATAKFPKGTKGIHLDAYARRALWDAGLDYDHGTGHGVGSFLSVHEGPQSLSRRGHAELEPGMIISNEPGLYLTDRYGIRIENLVLVKEPEEISGGDRPMMRFETLTFVPYDRRLIEPSLLRPDEADWIDRYHADVHAKIHLALDGVALKWLEQATVPLAR